MSRSGAYVGPYALHDELASGGMGTVHLGRVKGDAGFSRIVAIKRLHPHLAKESEFHRMFLDEARLAGRVRHPNVVPTLDVVEADGEILLVMEYVHGESLARLIALSDKTHGGLAPGVASAVMSGVLYGLHAAHESVDEHGVPLELVHRDVSPQNVIVGVDGLARVVDFGVAKAVGRLQTTSDGRLKGKLSYMAPEQIRGERVDRRTDVYAAGVVLWEALTGARLFRGENEGNTVSNVLLAHIEPPSQRAPDLPAALDRVVLRALARDPSKRFATAREMGAALIDACPPAAPHEVGEWVDGRAHEMLGARSQRITELESESGPALRLETAIATETTLTDGKPESERTVSQISSISVSSQSLADSAKSRRRGRLWFVLAAIAAMAAFALGSWSSRPSARTRARVGQVESREAASASLGSREQAAPSPAASLPEPPAVSLSAGLPPLSSASTSAEAPVPSAVAHPPRHTPARAPTPRPDNCTPPFVRDGAGNKVWKRECLMRAP
jgi:serine/threonine-protein kinase